MFFCSGVGVADFTSAALLRNASCVKNISSPCSILLPAQRCLGFCAGFGVGCREAVFQRGDDFTRETQKTKCKNEYFRAATCKNDVFRSSIIKWHRSTGKENWRPSMNCVGNHGAINIIVTIEACELPARDCLGKTRGNSSSTDRPDLRRPTSLRR